jgi:hypothetical protein
MTITCVASARWEWPTGRTKRDRGFAPFAYRNIGFPNMARTLGR